MESAKYHSFRNKDEIESIIWHVVVAVILKKILDQGLHWPTRAT
jgi:hypothetical protein